MRSICQIFFTYQVPVKCYHYAVIVEFPTGCCMWWSCLIAYAIILSAMVTTTRNIIRNKLGPYSFGSIHGPPSLSSDTFHSSFVLPPIHSTGLHGRCFYCHLPWSSCTVPSHLSTGGRTYWDTIEPENTTLLSTLDPSVPNTHSALTNALACLTPESHRTL